jgi:prephenate dehydratase
MKIAYLGPEKTFTEKVTKELFPGGDLVPLQPIRNVVMAVENGRVSQGVVPLENFYNGHVIHTLDSLTKCEKAKITQEKALKVVHCLGALSSHGGITKIYSKDQALEQCDEYLYTNFPHAETIATASTAEAADYIAKNNHLDAAAIAPQGALTKSGLEVIATDLCPNNSTRFVVLGENSTMPTGDDKTMLAIYPLDRDRPGVLADCLNIFSSQHINLECIYSRPDGKKGYFFYVELNGHKDEENVGIALQALSYSLDPKHKYLDTVKILGSFANSHWKDKN